MKIVSYLPEKRQTIMFSATMPPQIEKMAKTILNNPVEIEIALSKPAEKIDQSAYLCYERQKIGILSDMFKKEALKRVLIFVSSKIKVKELSMALHRMKVNVNEMHSDLDQKQRDEVMREFKAGHIDVLVATDIISRGIDIDDIQTVINYDVPHDVEDYIHRIGRTARADREGNAITLVNEKDLFYFTKIEKALEKGIRHNHLPEGLGEAPSQQQPAERMNNRHRSNGHRQVGNRNPNTARSEVATTNPQQGEHKNKYRKYKNRKPQTGQQ